MSISRKGIIIICLAVIAAFASCNSSHERKASPKYIFLFIGDGMGIPQTQLADNYMRITAGNGDTGCLGFLRTPVIGMISTYSHNKLITCSSAAGTALATGHKTDNGILGISADGDTLTSVAEMLKGMDYHIGLISSVAINHATPGAFYANSADRDSYRDIAGQLHATGFEFLGGGGLMECRNDSVIWNSLTDSGYRILSSMEEIKDFTHRNGNRKNLPKLFAISRSLSASEDIPYCIDRPDYDMTLSFFTQQMIDYFEPSGEPFFAMIESGKIDWACHANDAAASIHEIIELDKAYRKAYEFYLRHPDETLIIVTSDHETGGLGLGTSGLKYDSYPELLGYQDISGSEFMNLLQKNGTTDSNTFYDMIEKYFGFNNHDLRMALDGRDSSRINAVLAQKAGPTKITSEVLSVMSEKAGIGWTTHQHTGTSVPVYAVGAGSECFSGRYDNTDIPKKIMDLTK